MHKSHKSLRQFNLPKQLQYISSSSTNTTIPKHRECILFPTYAKRNPQGITKSVAGKKSTNELSNRMFEHRFKYFLANGKRNRFFYIEAIHAVDPTHTSTKRRVSSTTTMWDKSFEYPLLESVHTKPNIFSSTYSSATSSLNNTSTEEDDDDNDYTPPPTKTTTPTPTKPTPTKPTPTKPTPTKPTPTKPTPTKPTPTTARTTNKGVTLISESTGVFSGELHISHNQVLKWNSERVIKIKSLDLSKKQTMSNFPTSYGLVNLIEPTGVSIISDIDDTIKCTKVLAGARTVLTNTFFNPTRAVSGMADTYSQWYKLGASFHYVSNSPFQLTHMLNNFMTNHHFPPGSFHLRESTGLLSKLGASKKPGRSKHDSICGIMRDFPQKKFILIGDSGEIDLEIYTRIATEFPGQVIKIFIRDITSAAQLNLAAKKKRRYRRPTTNSASFPLFFTSNNTLKTAISMITPPSTDDDDDYVEISEDIASKIAELVLEPTLTGHSPVVAAPPSNNIHDLVDLATAPVSSPPPPSPSHNLMQLQTRLSNARGLLKDIEIVLFKDAKELCSDERVRHALHNCN
ncbi:hypothetical protein MFLAVUS_008179 [Mucor flavus]|uniref:Phosphatidate phosphatase APP1 catalytic domain-containing protein n=1 Tax=Mucor flavus TaxID=439312 RepID=A0ABP9Z6C8_9FUNG